MAHAGRFEGSPIPDDVQRDKTPGRPGVSRKVGWIGGAAATTVLAAATIIGIRGRGEEAPAVMPQNPDAPISRQVDSQPTTAATVKAEAPKNNLEKAPDFELKSITGETVRLSDYKGKPVVIYYWGDSAPKDSNKNLEGVVNAVKNSSVKDTVLFTIAGEGANTRVIEGITQSILIDRDVTYIEKQSGNRVKTLYLLDALKLDGYPATVFIDRKGEIMEKYRGPIEPSVLDSKIKGLDAIK